jgi:3-hydroxyisobutyrate dehydrogenase
MPRVAAVIGLGAMGRLIAEALRDGGWSLAVFDVDAARSAAVAANTVRCAASPADAAAGADLVVCVVASDAQLESALTGADGALEATGDGALIIVHSTVTPAVARRMAVAARERGADLIDAPLSGGVIGARERRLTTIVGGPPAALARARPALECYATTISAVGPVGSGLVVKLLNQLLATVQLGAVAEALAIAQAAGVDAQTLLDVVNSATGRCWASEGWDAILDGFASSPGGMAHVGEAILDKDLSLVQALARETSTATPMADAARAAIGRVVDAGMVGATA